MQTLLITLAVLMAVSIALRALQTATPAAVKQVLMRAGGGMLLAAAVAMLARGMTPFFALTTALLGAWLLFDLGTALSGQMSGAPNAGQVSRVTTDHLQMELDHASGAMRGRIVKGFFAGRRLEDLRPVELAHLWQDCRFVDPQSAQLVEAYLDRVHPSWRDDLARAEAEAPKGPDGKMTREEALDILGLKEGATEDDIRRAHRTLMLKMHPDRGGSNYLAAKINEAKDVALAGL